MSYENLILYQKQHSKNIKSHFSLHFSKTSSFFADYDGINKFFIDFKNILYKRVIIFDPTVRTSPSSRVSRRSVVDYNTRARKSFPRTKSRASKVRRILTAQHLLSPCSTLSTTYTWKTWLWEWWIKGRVRAHVDQTRVTYAPCVCTKRNL